MWHLQLPHSVDSGFLEISSFLLCGLSPPITHTPDDLRRKIAFGLNSEFEARKTSDCLLWP